eukprot:385727_1
MALRVKKMMNTLIFLTILIYETKSYEMKKIGTYDSKNTIEIKNIGPDTFDPNKLCNWQHDARFPLIYSNTKNSVVKNIHLPSLFLSSSNKYNIYFSGEDISSGITEIYHITTDTEFNNQSAKTKVISNGAFNSVMSTNVIRLNDTHYQLFYEAPITDNVRKIGYAITSNGIDFTPNKGNINYLLNNITNYPDRTQPNYTGNAILYNKKGSYDLYFTDTDYFYAKKSVFLAISNNNFETLEYVGMSVKQTSVGSQWINDIKLINGYYLLGLSGNTVAIKYAVSTNPNNEFPSDKIMFENLNHTDSYMTGMTWIVNKNSTILNGALYSASNNGINLENNGIYAIWLQKKCLFVLDDSEIVFGSDVGALGNGPSSVFVNVNQTNMNGKFYIYDTDYVNLKNRGTNLYVSPSFTVNVGDIWQLI